MTAGNYCNLLSTCRGPKHDEPLSYAILFSKPEYGGTFCQALNSHNKPNAESLVSQKQQTSGKSEKKASPRRVREGHGGEEKEMELTFHRQFLAGDRFSSLIFQLSDTVQPAITFPPPHSCSLPGGDDIVCPVFISENAPSFEDQQWGQLWMSPLFLCRLERRCFWTQFSRLAIIRRESNKQLCSQRSSRVFFRNHKMRGCDGCQHGI